MRKLGVAVLCTAAILSGCSKNTAEENANSSPMAEAAAPAADIALTAAPGVAFAYSYEFRLPDDQIASVQEQHAAACEVLGPLRCRISGMQYRLIRENEVSAQLLFKLDPAIARKFGKDAIASVEKAEGVLSAANISGDDVGSTITESQQRSAEWTAELSRIEARLTSAGLGDRERRELQQQAAALREQIASARNDRRAGEAQLKLTPLTFDYVGTGGLPGIGYGNPFSDAMTVLLRSGSTLLWFLLTAIAGGLPWVIAGGLVLALWRSKAGKSLRAWFGKPDKRTAAA